METDLELPEKNAWVLGDWITMKFMEEGPQL